MNRSNAESLVLQEWRGWASQTLVAGEPRTGALARRFVGYLQQERAALLDFPTAGDRGHDIHGWLLRRKEIVD